MAVSMTIVVPSTHGGDLLGPALDSIASALDGPGSVDRTGVDVVVVVAGEGAAAAAAEARRGDLPLTVVESAPDLSTMRNDGIRAASGDLVWLVDDRGRVTGAALDAHLRHNRADTPILMGPCPIPTGHVDGANAPWWFADRDVRLAEDRIVADPRDAAFVNTSAPTAALRAHPFTAGYRALGIEDLEVGMLLADVGQLTAFDVAAGIDAVSVETGDEITRCVHDGEDRARFVARHPDRHRVVFRTAPGRVERSLRRLVAAPIPARTPRALVLVGATLRRAASLPVVDRIGHRLRQFGAMSATYGGVAVIAESEPAVKRSLEESLATASILPGRVGRWWREEVADRLRLWSMPIRIHHDHGPQTIDRAADDLLVITVVRNGEFHVRAFLEHHRRLGIRHFLVLDNGSTDGTVALLRRQPDVTLLRTTVPYKTYENVMKRHLVRRYSTDRWNLFVDIDELFDYPGSEQLDLRGLLGYLEHHGFTAVVAQMLDLFPREPLADASTDPPVDLGERYPFFDVSDISTRPYHFDPDPASTLAFHRGGIRRTVFGSENALTKAPLIFVDERIETFVAWHHVRGATFADVTCVLRHYPFTPAFGAKAEEAARTGRYGLGASHEYRAYWAVLADRPDLGLHRESAERYEGPEQLVADGFLQVSDRYRQWVADHGSTGPRGPTAAGH